MWLVSQIVRPALGKKTCYGRRYLLTAETNGSLCDYMTTIQMLFLYRWPVLPLCSFGQHKDCRRCRVERLDFERRKIMSKGLVDCASDRIISLLTWWTM